MKTINDAACLTAQCSYNSPMPITESWVAALCHSIVTPGSHFVTGSASSFAVRHRISAVRPTRVDGANQQVHLRGFCLRRSAADTL
jgi:hypothetical protein